ncbi:MAG: hypothetical protein ACT4PN_05370 [Nitrospiraceae bacterium]
MPPQCTTRRQTLDVIIRSPGTAVDEVVLQCPNRTRNQVVTAIDRLSREEAGTLTLKGRGLYSVQVSDQASLNA